MEYVFAHSLRLPDNFTDFLLDGYARKVHYTCDLFFAKGVSLLYAIDNEALFCDVLAMSRIAVFDYTFALGHKITEVVGTGRRLCHRPYRGRA